MTLPGMDALCSRLAEFEPGAEHIAFRAPGELESFLKEIAGPDFDDIGRSREGRPLFGVSFGCGPLPVSIIAGSHADEPTGPMTAQALPLMLAEAFPEFLEYCTFHVVPQINPDGAARNRGWFATVPDFQTYVRCAVRELPGDDIEFGFGETPATRPECRAAMEFVRRRGPFQVHASLHGMGYAEGAWFLMCKEWAERGQSLVQSITTLCNRCDMSLYDIDRRGEKGFTRLTKGFCTTPTAVGMRAYFEGLSDQETAAKFLPSSMEFAQSLGGDPLCLVTELPMFVIHGESSLEDPLHWRFRDALAEGKNSGNLDVVESRFRVEPMPFQTQMKFQLAYLLMGIVAACNS